MAQDINVVSLVGRLTRDAEARTTAGGTPVTGMRLAFSTREKTGESWGDKSNYIDVTLWNREGLTQYLVKGARIGVAGRLQWREWTANDGTKRQTVEVVAQDVQLLDSKQDGGAQPAQAAHSEMPYTPPRHARVEGGGGGGDDDSIPFAASWA